MGLLNKKKNKKPLRTLGGIAAGSRSTLRPKQILKAAPCADACPSGTRIRTWLQAVAQRDKLGMGEEEALAKAWRILVDTNPFPAVMGRVCPHPCEASCSRSAKDGAVSIRLCERFIGDWALERRLALPVLEAVKRQESVGVVGAGPAGLSFAYQMARRGYPVTVYEKTAKPGGMVFWGIPLYRQPEAVLRAEVQRIVDLGVEIKYRCEVGRDLSAGALKSAHAFVFVAIGAHRGRRLEVPGEEGPGVWTGVEYLYRVKAKEAVDVGRRVAVVGGGDTAVDAARAARRAGADVTIVYRRTREEMPAIASEIADALTEGIAVEYLAAPVAIKRDGDKVSGLTVRRMALGEPDATGRRRPEPIDGSDYEVPLDTVIVAVSQEPRGAGLADLCPAGPWISVDSRGEAAQGVFAGGDAVAPGLVADAVGQGRRAALQAVAVLSGRPFRDDPALPPVSSERIKTADEEIYPPKARAAGGRRPADEWLTKPDEEIATGIDKAAFLEEASRCLSCGQCFGCERCWMYCTPGCFKKRPVAALEEPYYGMSLDTCDGCKKCEDECPCGYMDME